MPYRMKYILVLSSLLLFSCERPSVTVEKPTSGRFVISVSPGYASGGLLRPEKLIKLDTVTGESWIYAGDGWVPTRESITTIILRPEITWEEVVQRQEFQSLSPAEQKEVCARWFDKIVAADMLKDGIQAANIAIVREQAISRLENGKGSTSPTAQSALPDSQNPNGSQK